MPYLEQGKLDEATEKRLNDLISRRSFRVYWIRKRTFDLIVASILLLVLAIPIILIAIAVFLDDPHGSPFFKQIRIGRHGKEFYMYKFRTMYVDAEQRKKDLMDQNEMDGPVFKIKDDPRITRLGKYLRKLSVDELPQFFNVFRGDMSIVGPRPPLPGEVAEYSTYQKLRLIVTPGITCDWQIANHRNDIPFEQWVEMDLNYIENRTTWGDLKIIFRTPFAMLSATGR